MATKSVPVALVSMKNVEGDVAFNLERHAYWLERALETGARFVGFPEFSLTGWINDRRRALSLRSPAVREVERWARRRRVYLAVGFVEKCGARLHNCCLVAGPKGRVGFMRKINLVPKESRHYTSGREVPVLNVAGFRMSVATCADASCYEMFALPSLRGAEVIFAPHANTLGAYGNHAEGWLTWRLETWPKCAKDHAVYILGIDNAGLFERPVPGEIETKYCGGGAVFDQEGNVVAKAPVGKTKRECVVTATLDLAALRKARRANYRLKHFRAAIIYNRRTGWRHGRNG